MTSNGLFPKVLKHPAPAPPKKEANGLKVVFPLSVIISLYLLKNMNRKPWLELCFNTVAVTPLYNPPNPSWAIIVRTPSTKP
jgi:hypothetical protein